MDRIYFYMPKKNNCCFPHFTIGKGGLQVPDMIPIAQKRLFQPCTSKSWKFIVGLCISNSHFHSSDRAFPSASGILACYQVFLECQIEPTQK